MICLRLNSFLIDSEMSESATLKYKRVATKDVESVFRCHNNSNCNIFAIQKWVGSLDKQIQSLCFQVNNLLEKISQAAPEWTAQAMEAQMSR